MKTIFVVDDDNTNLITVMRALDTEYNTVLVRSVEQMFRRLEKKIPDLILLDVDMLGTDGFTVMAQLKENLRYARIPVIFLSLHKDSAIEERSFALGAMDFITKPFSPPILLHRVENCVSLDGVIKERTEKLNKLQGSIVFVLSDIIGSRDDTTGGHIRRTQAYLEILVNAMLGWGVYQGVLSAWRTEAGGTLEPLFLAAQLHDIGKIAVSDIVLNKPERLTAEEVMIMNTHTTAGVTIIDRVIERAGTDIFLEHAKLFALSHHEKWDGTGYPRGISGLDIPLEGRIMAVADVYDALTSSRPYKEALPHSEAVEIIADARGLHFEPAIVDVFMAVASEFDTMRREFFG